MTEISWSAFKSNLVEIAASNHLVPKRVNVPLSDGGPHARCNVRHCGGERCLADQRPRGTVLLCSFDIGAEPIDPDLKACILAEPATTAACPPDSRAF